MDELRRTADTAAEVAAEWGLEIGPRIPSKHSFVALVGDDTVLKVLRSDTPEYEHQPDALALWRGDHAVRLLRHERRRKAMLLERAIPGQDLSGEPGDDASQVAIEVGRAPWVAPPAEISFPNVLDLCSQWLATVAAQDRALVATATDMLRGIQVRGLRVVHGDLHHHNILRRGDGWAAIDPQPAIGEPEYDVVTLLWNPIGVTPMIDRTKAWIRRFETAGLDPARVREWAIVRGTILSFSSEPARRHLPQLRVVQSLL